MINEEEARALVLDRAVPRPARRLPLVDALGSVLAEAVTSGVDSPPYDKSLVDGYAVVVSDLATGQADLRLLEEVTAGQLPQATVVPGTTTRIMTGAPLPEGADAVVMVERSETHAVDGGTLVRLRDRLRPGQNILRRARSMRRHERVLCPGHPIRPIEIGLLAELGCVEVAVHTRPKVAVLVTGNELIGAGQELTPGTIRNSNGPMLCAAVLSAGGRIKDLGIARDDAAELEQSVRRGLEADVLLLSGGVSAGVLDLVPQVLRSLGVQQVFHKVRIKPGKPIWFGTASAGQLVFGLPGNPVSSLVCFERFVRPALGRLAGRGDAPEPSWTARLARPHDQRGDRATYFPAVLRTADDASREVEPLAWQGSADQRALVDANCLAYFPAGDRLYAAGEAITVYGLGAWEVAVPRELPSLSGQNGGSVLG